MTVAQLKYALRDMPDHLQVIILRPSDPDPGHDLFEVLYPQHIAIQAQTGRSRTDEYIRLVVYGDPDAFVV